MTAEQGAHAAAGWAGDETPVESGDISELLQAYLVALWLPSYTDADQPRR